MDIRDIKDAKVTHTGLLQHNADGTTELQKITHAGLVARSPEGTAAKGMNIRGNEDLWVEIQANTFRNWVNEHLKDSDMQVCVAHCFFLLKNHLILCSEFNGFDFYRFQIGRRIFVMARIYVHWLKICKNVH